MERAVFAAEESRGRECLELFAFAQVQPLTDVEKRGDSRVARAERLYETKKGSVTDEADGLREKGDEAMRKCFAQRVKSDPAFAKLTKQAQEYVDALAAK